MLFSTPIFTATLGGKNFLTKQQVFFNVAGYNGQKYYSKKYLHALREICHAEQILNS